MHGSLQLRLALKIFCSVRCYIALSLIFGVHRTLIDHVVLPKSPEFAADIIVINSQAMLIADMEGNVELAC
jgi:hypothetical protein